MSTSLTPSLRLALTSCVSTLRRRAECELPTVLDRRLLELGENKSNLNEEERAELMALLDFVQQLTTEKLEATLALRRLIEAVPELAEPPRAPYPPQGVIQQANPTEPP